MCDSIGRQDTPAGEGAQRVPVRCPHKGRAEKELLPLRPHPSVSLGKQLSIAVQCHLLRSKVASSAVTSCHSSQNDLQCAIGSLVSSQIWGVAPASEQAAQFDTVGGDPAAPCACPWCLPRGRHRRQDGRGGRVSQRHLQGGGRRKVFAEAVPVSWSDGPWTQSVGLEAAGLRCPFCSK